MSKTDCQCITCGIFYCRDSAGFSVSASNKLSCNLTGNCFEIGNKNIPPSGKPLNDYVRDKRTQEECIGFIDGYKARVNEEEILYTEQEVLDIARNSYNLRTFDKYVRSSKSFEDWFNQNKKK